MLARRESPPIIITPKPEEKTKEEPEQPATFQQPPTPRKNSAAKAIAVIAILVLVISVISFFSSGDKESVIESGKGIFKGEPEIPVFEDNFNRQEIGENWQVDELGIWQVDGELIGQRKNGAAWIDLKWEFEADELIITFDAWIESENWKPRTEIGLYISDGSSESKYLPALIFDGEAHICPEKNSGFRAFKPFSNPLKANKVYHVTAKRIEQGKNVRLSLIVTDENGKIAKDSKTIENKGKERIKIGFFSFNLKGVSYENNNDKVHIDNLKIYAYTT